MKVTKDHDCISKVRKQLKGADPTIGLVKFKLSTIKNLYIKNAIEKTGQEIEYSFTYTKKDGSKVEKTAKSFVSHDYCPFCGKKYE